MLEFEQHSCKQASIVLDDLQKRKQGCAGAYIVTDEFCTLSKLECAQSLSCIAVNQHRCEHTICKNTKTKMRQQICSVICALNLYS
jgi:hypothetical protein